MCGIFGYVGPKKAVQIVLEGLKRLEYRGYDSAGIAGISHNKIIHCKEIGRISALEKEVDKLDFDTAAAIAQTRWATHGKVTKMNAHPHFDQDQSLAIVHNGIIENHQILRQELIAQGISFISDTDTEVVAHLIATHYRGDILAAVQQTAARLKGAYAIALVHRDFPNQIIALAQDAPLVLGIGHEEAFVSSDALAFICHTRKVIYLSNGEIACVKADSQQIYSTEQTVDKSVHFISNEIDDHSKGQFEHYTLKEIFEQPQTLRSALIARFQMEFGTAQFEELVLDDLDLLAVERLLILGCGTSWHAGCVGAYMLEELARIPVQVEISSEFRYKNPIIPSGTLVIAISQSGETADTLAAVREVKAKGVKVLALCNVPGSTLVREADSAIFLNAGPEIGVCSTKAFTSQVIVLALFTLLMARMRHMSKSEGQYFLKQLLQIPEQVQTVLDSEGVIAEIAQRYAHYDNFFFIGRRYMYPTCLEGALKLKEISYINANGYPAGEIKHGPIALIDEMCPTVALCADRVTYDKLLSNLMEIKARNGRILALVTHLDPHLEDCVDDFILVPSTSDELSAIPITVATQLLAYHIAKIRGADIDHPRNLAKSVTVE